MAGGSALRSANRSQYRLDMGTLKNSLGMEDFSSWDGATIGGGLRRHGAGVARTVLTAPIAASSA